MEMLRELSIENLAVIEKASARFGESFNVFTGETGAGKSILIGGINAILGQRTTKDIVRTGAQKAVITALFDELSEEVRAKLSELGFSAEDDLLLTREIFADGKSAARINGRTATASMLKEIGSMLVDVHGQHENRILMSNDNQRDILDNYAGLSGELEEYRVKYREFARTSKRLKTLQDEANTRALKIEHLTAVIEDLNLLELEKGDGERLEQELSRVQRNADIVKASIGAYNCLSSDGEPAACDMLQSAAKLLAGIADVEPRAKELYERLTAVIPEVNDIADEVFSLGGDDVELQMQELTDKVSAIKHAKRKYNMDADELVDYLDECRDELAELSTADDEIELLTEKKRSLAEEVKSLAEGLSERRKKAADEISEEICRQLSFLDMPNVRIIFALNAEKIAINGKDSVELLISANAGEEPRPLNKIASGGELSRIMLAIKSVLADHDNIPTLIFDEVDAGISGRAAQKVGVKLSETAAKRQVLCITHLAQIAAKADTHLLIEKQTEDGRTFTHITQLDHDGRIHELARIIDGSGESESALAAAEEMLKK
ncbi:MAG: DNA repair protein RecN [Oscillospiraceae bacterium]|nr:DNA repair protein RecN [Oscillospiraceae bacterium]